MSLFKNKSLETRLQETETERDTHKNAFAALVAFIVSAFSFSDEQKAKIESGDNEVITTALGESVSAAELARDEAQTNLAESERLRNSLVEKARAVTTRLAAAFGITAEEVEALDTDEKFTAAFEKAPAIEKLGHKKALEIAASQGTEPIRTNSGTGDAEADEIKLAFQAAAEEPDPRKRGEKFAAASALLKQRSNAKNN
jgi:hypothetical protein